MLPDHGQSEAERQASLAWRSVYVVLDLPRPPSAADSARPGSAQSPPGATDLAERRRDELRRATAYSLPRTLVAIGAMIGIGVASLTTIVALAALGSDNSFGTAAVLLAGLGWEILVIVVVAGALQALFDLADAALHGVARQRVSS